MPQAKYIALAEELVKVITERNMLHGDKFPSSRDIARTYNVSQYTAMAAVDELKYLGVIDSKPQSGYYVTYSGWNALYAKSIDWPKYMDMGIIKKRTFSEMYPKVATQDLSAFGIGSHVGGNLLLERAMKACLDKGKFRDTHKFIDYRGTHGARKAIAKYLQKFKINATEDEILITDGTSNAVALIYFTFMRPGVTLLCDNYLYPKGGLINGLGINIKHVGIDSEGMIPEELKRILKNNRNAVLATPFGSTNPYANSSKNGCSSEQRRKQIIDICNIHNIPIIEIDSQREAFPAISPYPAKSLDGTGSILYISSLSKQFMEDFRFGWIVGPQQVIGRLADTRMQLNGYQNNINCIVFEELFTSGAMEEYFDATRILLDKIRKEVDKLLWEIFPECTEIITNTCSTTVFLKFADHVNLKATYEKRDNFRFTPGYIMDDIYKNYIPISIAKYPLDTLEKMLRHLSSLIKKHG